MATEKTKVNPAKSAVDAEKDKKSNAQSSSTSNASAENKEPVVTENAKPVLTGKAKLICDSFKHIEQLMNEDSLEYRGKGKPEEVSEQKRGNKTYAAGSREAQIVATKRWYATITRKIYKNQTDEINAKALLNLKAFVEMNHAIEDQAKNAQPLLDTIIDLYRGKKVGKKPAEKRALTLEDLFGASAA